MKSTELLKQDHKIILRSLDVLEEIAAKVHMGERPNPQDVESMLRFLRVFEDEHHQTKEESALFPELMSCAQSEQRSLRQMLFEHDQERSLVEGLEEAVRTEKGIDFVGYTHRLCSILISHVYKEDHILFDIIEHSFSGEQDEKVVAEFKKFDESLGAERKRGLLENLGRLEGKYLRKSA